MRNLPPLSPEAQQLVDFHRALTAVKCDLADLRVALHSMNGRRDLAVVCSAVDQCETIAHLADQIKRALLRNK